MTVQIRLIEQSDIPVVSAMLHELASEFILQETEPDLALRFLQSNSPTGIADNLANDYIYHVAERRGVIAGLLECARADMCSTCLWVNPGRAKDHHGCFGT